MTKEITVNINLAPKNDKDFQKWCYENDFDYINSERKAWCDEFKTYFRSAIGVANTKSGERFLIYEEY